MAIWDTPSLTKAAEYIYSVIHEFMMHNASSHSNSRSLSYHENKSIKKISL